jgi:ABC-type sugar transport system permease subunit
MTPVVMGFVWYYIYKLGVPSLLALMGIPDAANLELIGTKTSMMCVIITTVWLQMGTSMLIYSAAINGIPGDIYESAAIDGASRAQSFFRVTLPLITPAFLINMVNTLITGFKQFDQIQAMTKGGPAKTTETLTILIHYHALMRNDYGYASAISALLLLIVLALLMVLVRCFSVREYT